MTTQPKILDKLRYRSRPVDWDQVFTEELPRVFNFFLYKTSDQDTAQDLTAATFERAWRTRSRYRQVLSSPTTWLFGFARNVLKEHLRKCSKTDQSLEKLNEDGSLQAGMDVESSVQSQMDKEYLQNLLLELPDREQDLIALKYGAGLTNREIAKVAGLSESNVGTILHRTVNRLRREWDENYGR